MATAPETRWPFLVVLMSSPTSGEPPRVRGLGFKQGDVVVTLDHIARDADLIDFAEWDDPWPVRPLTTEGGLALMAISRPPTTSDSIPLAVAKGPVEVATVSDLSPTTRVLHGHVDEPDPGGRFTVALDDRLGEDWTASGSPVVSGRAVVGIVAPTATSGSVDAFGTAAIERLLASAEATPSRPDQFSAQTWSSLNLALRTVNSLGSPAAVLLGVLQSAMHDTRETVPAQLLRHVTRERVARAFEPYAEATGVDASAMTAQELGASAVGPMLAAAEAVRGRVGEERVHRRHLLAAALLEPADAFPEGFFETLGLSQIELRRALQEVIASTYDPHDPWDRVLGEPEAEFALAGGHSADLVDPTKGIKLEDDHLGLGVDVTMLAALVTDVDTPMPLSIGLFGEWGSGKSYFMGLLRGEIKRLAQSSNPRYRSEVVQIGFNAWHYADSNLWASLGDEIFEQLAGPNAETSEAVRKALQADLDERLQRRAELKAATERAQAETRRLAGELDDAAAQRRTSARDLAAAVLGAPALREELDPALDKLGAREPAEQIRLLADELERVPADAADVRRAAAGLPHAWIAAGVGLAIAAVAAAVAASGALGGLGTAAAVALGAAGVIARRARSGARALHQVAESLRRRQDEALAPELKQLRDAETTERMLQTQLDETVRQVGELSRELAELAPGQRLYSFIAERASSDTYRAQLGLISTIRKDFEQLNDLMKLRRKNRATGAHRPIDRIVLYIDDLDRCSPKQVVEVLQAVHLLLAIDLFVVVVGVDPRWLLRSLRREYRSLLTTDGAGATDDRRWESTPQDYLEKIFNIPFALPRMTEDSFGDLVGKLVKPKEKEEEEAAAAEESAAPPPQAGAEEEAPTSEAAGTRDLELRPAATAEPRSPVVGLRSETAEAEPRPLTDPELAMLKALAPLVETPRETKRLVNLYRMMRSTRDLSPAARFLGDDDTPGEYQAVVILLGLLSGHARLLHDVLVAPAGEDVKGGLRGRAPTETWKDFAAGLAPREHGAGARNDIIGEIPPEDVEEWRRLAEGLPDASALVTHPDLRPFQKWAPRIARFSFLLSPYADENVAMSRRLVRR